jgi:hypothetical protein
MASHYDGAAALVNPRPSRYPARMEPLTIDALSALARARGLELTGEELAALLPVVQALRSSMDALRDAPLGDVEPAAQFRIV